MLTLIVGIARTGNDRDPAASSGTAEIPKNAKSDAGRGSETFVLLRFPMVANTIREGAAQAVLPWKNQRPRPLSSLEWPHRNFAPVGASGSQGSCWPVPPIRNAWRKYKPR